VKIILIREYFFKDRVAKLEEDKTKAAEVKRTER